MNRHARNGMQAAHCCCVHVCVRGYVIDTLYQLIYTPAQTQLWSIQFSYKNIREYKARSKGRVRAAAARGRPFDHAL
jgi:hypothetical protein